MSEELQKMLEQAKGVAVTFYQNQDYDYEMIPMYALFKQGEPHTLLALADLPDNPAVKNALVLKIRAMADKEQCDAWSFCCEGWTLPKERLESYAGGMRFADQPDRVEMLTVSVGVASGDEAHVSATIQRVPGQAPILTWNEPAFSTQQGMRMNTRWNIFNMQVPDAGKLAAIRANAAS